MGESGDSSRSRSEESSLDWRKHIVSDPNICHGKACIKGTRVMVTVILDSLASGEAPEQIVRSFPSVTVDDVKATIGYAAELARERQVPLPA
jgi:uncharacterized protein (DUF433 family)